MIIRFFLFFLAITFYLSNGLIAQTQQINFNRIRTGNLVKDARYIEGNFTKIIRISDHVLDTKIYSTADEFVGNTYITKQNVMIQLSQPTSLKNFEYGNAQLNNNKKTSKQTLSLGIKGGPYNSTIKYTKGDYAGYTFNKHNGYIFGVFVNLPFTKNLSLQPEILHINKGGTYSHPLSTYFQKEINFDYKINSNHLGINLKYEFLNSLFTPYALLGFSFAISNNATTYRQVVYEDDTSIALKKLEIVSQIGYRGAAGFYYQLTERFESAIELFYDNTRVHVKEQNSDFYSGGFGISLNLQYNFQ